MQAVLEAYLKCPRFRLRLLRKPSFLQNKIFWPWCSDVTGLVQRYQNATSFPMDGPGFLAPVKADACVSSAMLMPYMNISDLVQGIFCLRLIRAGKNTELGLGIVEDSCLADHVTKIVKQLLKAAKAFISPSETSPLCWQWALEPVKAPSSLSEVHLLIWVGTSKGYFSLVIPCSLWTKLPLDGNCGDRWWISWF